MVKLGSHIDMDSTANDNMIYGLVSRIERDGHHLTPSAVAKIHAVISDCVPDRRAEGSQKELAELVRERIERDDR